MVHVRVHVVKLLVAGLQILLQRRIVRLRGGKIAGLQILGELIECLRNGSGC